MSILALTILGLVLLVVLVTVAIWPKRPDRGAADRRLAPGADPGQLRTRSPKAA